MDQKSSAASLKELRSLFFAIRCLMRERLPGSARDQNTWLRLETLHFLSEHAGCSLGELAQYLRVSLPSASSLARALTRTNLVRRGSASDRRSVRLFVTVRGKQELRAAERESMRAMQGVFGFLSERERKALEKLLRTIVSKASTRSRM